MQTAYTRSEVTIDDVYDFVFQIMQRGQLKKLYIIGEISEKVAEEFSKVFHLIICNSSADHQYRVSSRSYISYCSLEQLESVMGSSDSEIDSMLFITGLYEYATRERITNLAYEVSGKVAFGLCQYSNTLDGIVKKFTDTNISFIDGYLDDSSTEEMRQLVFGVQASPQGVVEKAPTLLSIMTSYNEKDIIEESINHLLAQGSDIHVIDNWSDDGTYELVKDLSKEHPGKVTHERFPGKKPSVHKYDWKKLLTKVEKVALNSNYDWIMHNDADELRISPWRNIKIIDAIAYIQKFGYTAVDFTVADFRPTSDGYDGKNLNDTIYHYEYSDKGGYFQQIKLWKNQKQIDLASSGGHNVQFPDKKIYPLKFFTKHYPIRSTNQGNKKIFDERKKQFNQSERKKGWHIQYDQYHDRQKFVWKKNGLYHFDNNFYSRQLTGRLSGYSLGNKREHLMKNILIFSYNPIPTAEYTKIEGSSLRFWRMAKSLQSEGYTDIKIAIWEKFPQSEKIIEGISITNFTEDEAALKKLCCGYDTIIFTCAMGNLSEKIYNAIDPNSRIIIDAYSPMYVEFLTKSQDTVEDNILVDVYRGYASVFDRQLIGADHILVANDNQKHFYRGVLGGLAALTEHDDSRFVHLPAFVEKDSQVTNRTEVGRKINVLWFGGVYPWFDITDVINVFCDKDVQSKAVLTIVGGSNPFYPKDNMRYNGKYIKAVQVSDENGLTDKVVFFRDWVDYTRRISDVFNHADVAISMNSDFIENDYSFRLRVADLAGNGVPIVTNGGDYLGEELIQKGVAFKLDISNIDSLKQSLISVLNDRDEISKAREKLRDEYFEDLHLDKYIPNLINAIESDKPLRHKLDNNIYLDAVRDHIDAPRVIVEPKADLTDISLDDVKLVSTKKIVKLLAKRITKSGKDRAKRILKHEK